MAFGKDASKKVCEQVTDGGCALEPGSAVKMPWPLFYRRRHPAPLTFIREQWSPLRVLLRARQTPTVTACGVPWGLHWDISGIQTKQPWFSLRNNKSCDFHPSISGHPAFSSS